MAMLEPLIEALGLNELSALGLIILFIAVVVTWHLAMSVNTFKGMRKEIKDMKVEIEAFHTENQQQHKDLWHNIEELEKKHEETRTKQYDNVVKLTSDVAEIKGWVNSRKDK